MLKYPSAWLPIALPALWLAIIGTILAMNGIPIAQSKDEGTLAHLFQLWLVIQPVLVGYFVFFTLPGSKRHGLIILSAQLVATIAACFPVWYFNF